MGRRDLRRGQNSEENRWLCSTCIFLYVVNSVPASHEFFCRLVLKMTSILVFIPKNIELRKTGYIEGFYQEFDDCKAFYITNPKIFKKCKDIIGIAANDQVKSKLPPSQGLYLDSNNGKLSLINCKDCFMQISYDYDCFKMSNIVPSDESLGKHFKILIEKLRNCANKNSVNEERSRSKNLISIFNAIFNLHGSFFFYSSTVSHFYQDLHKIKSVITPKTETPKIWNFITAKLINLAIGYYFLAIFLQNEDSIVEFITGTSKIIISSLKDLLTYLMGSPIGLKLNYSFNRSLGTFFFYHISLWRIFLETIQPFIKNYFLRLYFIIGTFGISYQIAMISDIISIATFHVYCIYVYAARLFSLQLQGLLSLSRLFIGRKFNPLRQRVDSYQYSQNQLFIGTLGFTILLFLLPTTTMYYAVFIIFRLGILIIDKLFESLRNFSNSIPLYVVALWLARSPQLAGLVCIEWNKDLCLEAHLKLVPLSLGVKKLSLDNESLVIKEWLPYSTLIRRIFTGVLI